MSRTLISKYMSVDALLPTLQKGDIIEFLDTEIYNKLVYFCLSPDDLETDILSNYTNERGVYIGESDGDYYVVHGLGSRLAKSKLSDAAAGRQCRLNNGFDFFYSPSPSDVIAKTAIVICNRSTETIEDSMRYSSFCRYRELLSKEDSIAAMRLVRIYHYEKEELTSHEKEDELAKAIDKLTKRERRREKLFFNPPKNWLTADELVKELYIGDMVEFKSNLAYTNVTGGASSGSKSATSRTGSAIQQASFSEVARQHGKLCRVNNHAESQKMNVKEPLAPLEIVGNALRSVKDLSKEYNVVIGNCEHYATLCRYGRETSGQIHKVIHYALLGTCGSLIIGVGGFPICFGSAIAIWAHGSVMSVFGHTAPEEHLLFHRPIHAVADLLVRGHDKWFARRRD